MSRQHVLILVSIALVAMQATAGRLAERCQQMLDDQREYDSTHHALSVARVLQEMTEEMRKSPVNDVLPLLTHSEWELRYAAARALIGNSEARTDTVRSALAGAVATDTNEYSLPEIIQATYYTRAMDATPALCSLAVSNQYPSVRYAAVEAQYWLRDPRAVQALLQSTRDASSNVALRAVYVLAGIGDDSALPRLRELAFQAGGDMQIQAVQALGTVRDQQSTDRLRDLLKTDKQRLLEYSIRSLGQVGDGKAVPQLITFLSHEQKAIEDAAYQALLEIGNVAVFDHFVDEYKTTPHAELPFRAIASLYQKHIANLPDKRPELKPDELLDLATLLTTSLREERGKTDVRRIAPEHIRTVREFRGVTYVSVDFGHSGLDALVLRDKNGRPVSARMIGGWVE